MTKQQLVEYIQDILGKNDEAARVQITKYSKKSKECKIKINNNKVLTITDDLKSIDKKLKKKVKKSVKDLLKKSSCKSSYIVNLTSDFSLSDLQDVELLTIVSIQTITANAFNCYATKKEMQRFEEANNGKCMVMKDEIISIPENEKKQIKAINDDDKYGMKERMNKSVNIQYLRRIGANNSSRRIGSIPTQNPDFTFDELDKKIRVFVLDTGIATHSNLRINRELSYDFTSNNPRDYTDRNGHGTHVAGTIGAAINAQFINSGVAPNIELIAYKVFQDNGSGSTSDIYNALERIRQYKKMNPDEICIVNMSLVSNRNRRIDGSGNVIDTSFEQNRERMNDLIDSGVIIVVAAGNDNRNADTRLPAAVPEVITVGAYDSTTNRIASFSNHGPSVDIMAPGVFINNTWWNPVNSFRSISGTSMAAPIVTGAIVNMVAVALRNRTGKLATQFLEAAAAAEAVESTKAAAVAAVEAAAAAAAKIQNVVKEILQEDAEQSNLRNLNPLIINNFGISYPQNTTNLGVYIGSYVQNGTTIANY